MRQRRDLAVDLDDWCEHLRIGIPLLGVFNDGFLLGLIERPLEALELGGGDPRRMREIIGDADSFPAQALTQDGHDAVRRAVQHTRVAGITSSELFRIRPTAGRI